MASAKNALESGIKSQFPGTVLEEITTNTDVPDNVDKLLENVLLENEKIKPSISAISTVASIRDKSKTENKNFIQGIERFIDSMSNRNKSYTAIFIADPISAEQRATIRAGMESLYTAIAPFAKSVWSYNENDSEAVMKSLRTTVGHSVTDGTTLTQSHTVSHTTGSSNTVNIGVSAGMNKSDGTSKTVTKTKKSPWG